MDGQYQKFQKHRFAFMSDLNSDPEYLGAKVFCTGEVQRIDRKEKFMLVTISDSTGLVECVVF